MEDMFFGGWDTLARTALVGVLAYVSLVVLLRLSGRRTLSKMNAFDFVVTVALGSTLATILLNSDVSLAEGTLAFALLIGLQYLVTWSSVRVAAVRKIVTGEPALLLHAGKCLPTAMRKARVTQAELQSAVRSAGLASVEDAAAVVIETDGSFSVIGAEAGKSPPSLEGVTLPPS